MISSPVVPLKNWVVIFDAPAFLFIFVAVIRVTFVSTVGI